ncbi:MAG: hypothetical protein CUN55_04530 [Phototrophicales bacterium]|nr:MAG: hypothetical protein CUN55_04530 [Phototrophicales bacterium]
MRVCAPYFDLYQDQQFHLSIPIALMLSDFDIRQTILPVAPTNNGYWFAESPYKLIHRQRAMLLSQHRQYRSKPRATVDRTVVSAKTPNHQQHQQGR